MRLLQKLVIFILMRSLYCNYIAIPQKSFTVNNNIVERTPADKREFSESEISDWFGSGFFSKFFPKKTHEPEKGPPPLGNFLNQGLGPPHPGVLLNPGLGPPHGNFLNPGLGPPPQFTYMSPQQPLIMNPHMNPQMNHPMMNYPQIPQQQIPQQQQQQQPLMYYSESYYHIPNQDYYPNSYSYDNSEDYDEEEENGQEDDPYNLETPYVDSNSDPYEEEYADNPSPPKEYRNDPYKKDSDSYKNYKDPCECDTYECK